MKRWIIGFLAVVCAVSSTVPAPAAPDELVAAVMRREAERQRAMVEVDVPALEDIFAEDATYVHSNGLFQTKAGVLAMLTKKELRYVSFDIKESSYRRYGNTVVCTGVQSIQLTSSGRPFTSNSRYTLVWAEIDGKPRVVSYQSTLLPEIVKQETHTKEE